MDIIKKQKLELKRIVADSKRQQENIKTIKKLLELKKKNDNWVNDKWNIVSRKQGKYFEKYTNDYYKNYEQLDFIDYLYDENRHAEWYQTKLDFENGFEIFKQYNNKTEKNYTYISEKGLTTILNYTQEYLEDVEQELYLNLSIRKESTEKELLVELQETKEQQERKRKKRQEKKKRFEEERKEIQSLIIRGYSEDELGLKKYNKRLKDQQVRLKELDDVVIESNKESRKRILLEEREEQTDIVFTIEERKLHTLTKYTFCNELKNVDSDIKNHVYTELYSINRMENYACLEGELPILQPVAEELEEMDIEPKDRVIEDVPDKEGPILSDVLMEKINGYRPNRISLQVLNNLKEDDEKNENEEFKNQQKYIREYPKLGKLFIKNRNKEELYFNANTNMFAYNNSKLKNDFMYRLNEISFYKRNVPELITIFQKIRKLVAERKEGEQQYKKRISELNLQLIREYFIFDEVLKSQGTSKRFKKIRSLIDFFILITSIIVIKEIYLRGMPYLDPTFDLDLIIETFMRRLNPVYVMSEIRDYINNIIYYEDAKKINAKLLQNEALTQIIESGNPIGQLIDSSKNYKLEHAIEFYSTFLINNLLEICNKNKIEDFCDLDKNFLIAILDII